MKKQSYLKLICLAFALCAFLVSCDKDLAKDEESAKSNEWVPVPPDDESAEWVPVPPDDAQAEWVPVPPDWPDEDGTIKNSDGSNNGGN